MANRKRMSRGPTLLTPPGRELLAVERSTGTISLNRMKNVHVEACGGGTWNSKPAALPTGYKLANDGRDIRSIPALSWTPEHSIDGDLHSTERKSV
jgi:hypothetical protein